MNARAIYNKYNAAGVSANNYGLFLMSCYSTLDGRVAAFGKRNVYYYSNLDELNAPIGKEDIGWKPESDRFLGKFYCQKSSLHTEEYIYKFFGVESRPEIGTGFNIRELMYVQESFLEYIKNLRDFGVRPSNCQGWSDCTLLEVKKAFQEGKDFFELLGHNNVPEWVEYNLQGLSQYRYASALKSALIKCKADWAWQKKSVQFWVETGFKSADEALQTIREINISHKHAFLVHCLGGVESPQEVNTSSYEKVFTWYGACSLKAQRCVEVEGEVINISTIPVSGEVMYGEAKETPYGMYAEFLGYSPDTTKYVVWGSDFITHFEGNTLKEAIGFWVRRNLTTEEIILRDGVSFSDVKRFGYCLAGTQGFLSRKASFIYKFIAQYSSWGQVPQDIMGIKFSPTPEFAQAIVNRY